MSLALGAPHYRRTVRTPLPSTNFKFSERSREGKININGGGGWTEGINDIKRIELETGNLNKDSSTLIQHLISKISHLEVYMRCERGMLEGRGEGARSLQGITLVPSSFQPHQDQPFGRLKMVAE